jgi:uridine kinase
MQGLDEVVARIVSKRKALTERRCLLVGVSGIDASGKGFVTRQLEAHLKQHSIATANVNIDGWLNLPTKRFSPIEPGQHFYENSIRFDELFDQLILPLRDNGCIELIADFTDETAENYRQHTYSFQNIAVVLVEGIFLLKRKYRKLFDLAIWTDCSFSTALRRALERAQEGLSRTETTRAYETIYFPAQKIHLQLDRPRESADLRINNDSCFSH